MNEPARQPMRFMSAEGFEALLLEIRNGAATA